MTFTISGAVFGRGINWTDIDTGSDLTKVAGSIGNGRAGDSSVAVKIGTTGVTGATGAESNATVTLYIGSLEGAAGLASGDASVTASASVRVTAGGGSNFPDKVETPTASSNVIADSEKAWTVAPQGRLVLRGWINLDDRTKLVPVFASDSSTLATIGLFGSSGPKEADGKTFFRSGAGSRANIYVNVSGTIRDTDSVFVDLDQDGKIWRRGRPRHRERRRLEEIRAWAIHNRGFSARLLHARWRNRRQARNLQHGDQYRIRRCLAG